MLGGMNTGYGAENRMGGLHDNINPEGDSKIQNHHLNSQGSPFMDQNQLQVDNFFETQTREQVEEERKNQEQREKDAAKNQMTKA